MSELSPEARALIDEAATADSAKAEDRKRVRDKLAVTLGASAFASGASVAKAATSAGSAATSAATATGLGLGTKVLMSAVVIGAVGVGVATQAPDTQAPTQPPARPVATAPATAATPATPTTPTTPAVVERAPSPQPVPVEAAEPIEPVIDAPAVPSEPETAAVPRRGRGKRKDRTAYASKGADDTRPMAPSMGQPPAKPGPAAEPVLAAELNLIGAAQRALRGGDARQALTHLDAHARRFPDGNLRLERQSVRALSLCKLGRLTEGRKVAADVERIAPNSPLAERVQRACNK